MRTFPLKLIGVALLSTQLIACFPAVVGGAATGGAMAGDRRTSGVFIDDQAIELKARKMIIDNIGSANINVSVTSYNQNVLLTGEAIDEATKEKAERAARSVENVKNVINELTIGEKSSMRSRSNDTLLTSKVKTNLLKDKRLHAHHVKVVTENSVVYLMGIVSRDEAEAAVEVARDINGVHKVVKVFEYTD